MDRFPRHSRTRILVERELLSKGILNVVACEGLQRHLRGERSDRWAERMHEAGFVKVLAPEEAIHGLQDDYGQGFGLHVNGGEVMFAGYGSAVAACSLWTTNGQVPA